MSARRGPRISFAFLTGILGSLLILGGALLPQLSVPDHVTEPLFDPTILLADPLAATGEAGLGVVVFALFAIGFCLVGRYLWLIFCAIMIVLFLSVALMRQLTDMLGLTIPQIIDMYNGVLPPDVDAAALLSKLPVLQATTYDDGLLVLGVGLLLIELAPWLRRLQFGSRRWQTVSKAPAESRREPTAVVQAAPAPVIEQPNVPPDLLLDELYIFADGLEQPLTFSLLDPAGRVTRHRVRLEAAGYLGDSYFLRCRDLDIGNLRDFPAHMLSEIVDDQTGSPIDTDDMLDDLARVAYEVVEGLPAEAEGDQAGEQLAPTAGSATAFSVETTSSAPPGSESRPQGAG
jgi:hypothetical protein